MNEIFSQPPQITASLLVLTHTSYISPPERAAVQLNFRPKMFLQCTVKDSVWHFQQRQIPCVVAFQWIYSILAQYL